MPIPLNVNTYGYVLKKLLKVFHFSKLKDIRITTFGQ